MGQDFDPTTPADASFISVYPANERSERLKLDTWAGVEHYEGAANEDRHKIYQADDDTDRDGEITTPQDGNIVGQIGPAPGANSPRALAWQIYGKHSAEGGGSEKFHKMYPCFTGMVVEAAFDVATPPEGWLACDGAAVARATYDDLFTVIATTFDNQNGADSPAGTDFRVPNKGGMGVVGVTAGKHGQAGWVRNLSGQNDIHVTGTFSGSGRKIWIVEITTGGGGTNVFRWSNDAGASFTAGVNCATSATLLVEGISVEFASVSGHTDGDIWCFVTDDQLDTVGNTVGVDAWQLDANEIPDHPHAFSGTTDTDGGHDHEFVTGGDGTASGAVRRGNTSVGDVTYPDQNDVSDHPHAFSGTTDTDGGDDRAHENVPHAVVMGHLIKT